MKFLPWEIEGLVVIEPEVHRDSRGFFLETFQARKYKEAGLPDTFVQDNHSFSRRGVLRGLHGQKSHPQGKLVRVVEGEVFDVAVDIRCGSPTFCRWASVILSSENLRLFYIPPGFLHGFCVLSERAQFEYKVTDFYAAGDELGVIWNDPDLGIEWPVKDPILSAKDKVLPPLGASFPKRGGV